MELCVYLTSTFHLPKNPQVVSTADKRGQNMLTGKAMHQVEMTRLLSVSFKYFFFRASQLV